MYIFYGEDKASNFIICANPSNPCHPFAIFMFFEARADKALSSSVGESRTIDPDSDG